jgi:16S rRNA processing protein RimM
MLGVDVILRALFYGQLIFADPMTDSSTPIPISIASASAVNPGLADDWLEVGRIVAAQGLAGEVRIYPDSDFPERFQEPGLRWLRHDSQSQPQPLQLQRGRLLAHKGLYVVKFEGIDSREQAESLKGAMLLVKASDRPELDAGEFYLQDLVGLTAINQQNQTIIGTVIGIVYAGNTLLEIQRGPIKFLVPFVEAIVPIVDLAQQRIEIHPLPGLLPQENGNLA